MIGKYKFKNIFALILTVSVFLTANFISVSAEDQSTYCSMSYVDNITASFSDYQNTFPKNDTAGASITVSAEQPIGGVAMVMPDGTEAMSADDSQTISFQVNIEQSGWYEIVLSYWSGYSEGKAAERTVLIDGQLPYSEAANLVLFSAWEDDGGVSDSERRFKTDKNGNELLFESVEKKCLLVSTLCDAAGYLQDPLQIYLTPGQHSVSLAPGAGKCVLTGLYLRSPEKVLDYSEYKNQYAKESENDSSIELVQGENYYSKSSSEILPLSDRSSVETMPSDPYKMLFNTVGGTSWGVNGQWIEWKAQVPEDGLYRIGLRYRQNFLSGMRSNRRLLIDNELPFEQAGNLTFEYSSKWKNSCLGNEDGDYLFYMSKGEHTIRLECSLGEFRSILQNAQSIVASLNSSYQQLIMYIGNDPDLNRDYKVEQMLPGVMENLNSNCTELKNLSSQLIEFSGERGSANVEIDNLYDCVKRMCSDSRDIPSMLSAFQDYQASLSTWIQSQSVQPLEIDYLYICGKDKTKSLEESKPFGQFLYGIKSFISSFVTDYSMMSSGDDKASIEVWVNTGRDQAQILNNMITNYYTPQSGIGVKLKLVTGQLLLATMAGVGPDVSLFNSAADIMNFAFRDAVEPLEENEGFSELKNNYAESAWTPISFEDHIYAIPETQSLFVMFYRADVLSELGLELPNTWKELYTVIGELQRNNLQFGFPNSIYSYGIMLYQRDGNFYAADHKSSDLTSVQAVEAFKDWTRLYTNYGLPYEYSDVNRFRSGEMPLLIGDYALYFNLSVSAPEIKGRWGFTLLPGIESENSKINRSAATSTSGAMILKSGKNKDEAWDFLRWWTSTDIQTKYGKSVENTLGTAARYASANLEVLSRLPWNSKEIQVLKSQLENSRGIPEIPGSYYTARYLENAFRRVINYHEDERETISTYAQQIDEEIAYKNNELLTY